MVMSALPNCFKTDLFRKKLTSEILNSLWIMPYQSHCFALGTAEIRSMRQASKCLHEVKDVSHFSITVMRGTKQVLPVPRHLMGLRGGMDLQVQGKEKQQWMTWFLLDLFHDHNARGEKETGLFRCCCSVLSLTKAPEEVQADTSCCWFEMLS